MRRSVYQGQRGKWYYRELEFFRVYESTARAAPPSFSSCSLRWKRLFRADLRDRLVSASPACDWFVRVIAWRTSGDIHGRNVPWQPRDAENSFNTRASAARLWSSRAGYWSDWTS